ncbi:hypothetical protein DW083_19970 [Parabacteroides sp. AF48-14]|uniref:hypothetical protein n=1 Tax=unclassified Parabacteroides TaxID=2649774 RepID=UPI000F00DAED|nr:MULTISPECIES: hypothetical protein [unclassified Parabacteroides]RHO65850.1 hypothetical protein DW083_19970 [Parabacteroides sp. AF48-14]RHR61832.1 hypothetical protein DWW90_03420 [Parabacteroides sp. AF17-28]
MKRLTVQLTMAILLTMSGIVLLFCGFWIEPQGEVDNSVLVAFGEISTFAGALFGVDYSYKLRIKN